jgi:hypothetical protein
VRPICWSQANYSAPAASGQSQQGLGKGEKSGDAGAQGESLIKLAGFSNEAATIA